MAFTSEYETPEAYILGITERIWEGRGVDLIRGYYAPDVRMHTGLGDSQGVEGVVSGTLETLHSFPDRRLLAEDIIWSDDPGGVGYSSHRVGSVMRHDGAGLFGPPTGRTVQTRTMADCLVRDGVIFEEWLVRDQAGIAVQLGLDPAAVGRELAAAPYRPVAGTGAATLADDAGGACAADLLRVWNEAALSRLRTGTDPAAMLHLPGNRVSSGHDALDRFTLGYLAAFPGATVTVEHVITRADPGRPVRVALRWRLEGVHAGRGAFGVPSGAPVAFPAVTHLELLEGRVTRAFVLIDEVGIWAAIGRKLG